MYTPGPPKAGFAPCSSEEGSKIRKALSTHNNGLQTKSVARKRSRDLSSVEEGTGKLTSATLPSLSQPPAIRSNETRAFPQPSSLAGSETEIDVLGFNGITQEGEQASQKEMKHAGTQCDTVQIKSKEFRMHTFKQKNQTLRQTLSRLRKQYRKAKEQLQLQDAQIKEMTPNYDLVNDIKTDAIENQNPHAIFLLDLVHNFNKIRPKWSESTIRHCIIWRGSGPAGYETARTCGLLRSPARTTLDKYLCDLKNTSGVSPLARARLEAECEELEPISRIVSLVIDETFLQPRLYFNKQTGQVEGFAEKPDDSGAIGANPKVANKLLCFALHGLNVKFTIPAAYYLVANLTGDEQTKFALTVLKEVTHIGFIVVRVVVDNAKINVAMFKQLCGGETINFKIEHPFLLGTELFLSFDYVHVEKNICHQMNQDNLHDMEGPISGVYSREIYKLQRNMTFKPVRHLAKKHVDPQPMQKMSVKRAVQMFASDLIATIESMMLNKVVTASGVNFARAGPTIRFMKHINKFFTVHDVSSRSQQYRFQDPDRAEYTEVTDPRLAWLTNDFLGYIKEVQQCSKEAGLKGLTAETYEALMLTCKSTAACIAYLLELGFFYVLPRKMSSDCVEALFSATKRSLGWNTNPDGRNAICGIRNILKTGLMYCKSNANIVDRVDSTSNVTLRSASQLDLVETEFPPHLLSSLANLEDLASTPFTFSIGLASIVFVGGYIVRTIDEKLRCGDCIGEIMRPKTNNPIYDLISLQDKGYHYYPSNKMIQLCLIVQEFVERGFQYCPRIGNHVKIFKGVMKEPLMNSGLVGCGEHGHRSEAVDIFLEKFLRPLIKNLSRKISMRQLEPFCG
ncbi:hypothetical protein B566_EDAN003523 [Ephemera danica]|nr:hypothetical protein B566_EDAN003523 [Ephemera danica]